MYTQNLQRAREPLVNQLAAPKRIPEGLEEKEFALCFFKKNLVSFLVFLFSWLYLSPSLLCSLSLSPSFSLSLPEKEMIELAMNKRHYQGPHLWS